MRQRALRSVLVWLGVAFSIGFGVIAVRDVDLQSFWDALSNGKYWLLVPSGLMLGFGLYLRALRWQWMFVREPRPPLGDVTSALLIGYLFNAILPVRAGEAARIVVLNQRAGVSLVEALATVIGERVLDVLVLLALLFVSAPLVPESSWMRPAALVGGAAFVLLTIFLSVTAVYGTRPVRFLLRPAGLLPNVSATRLDEAAENLVRGLAVFRHPGLAFKVVAGTVASWVVIAISFWLCLLAVRVDLGLDAALLVVIATNLALILPSGPGALGVFEAATVLTLVPFDVERSRALSYAVVVHALNLLIVIAVGYVALHRHVRSLRRQRADEDPADGGMGAASRAERTSQAG